MAISLVILLFSLLTLAFPLILCVNFVASSCPHSTPVRYRLSNALRIRANPSRIVSGEVA